ncbi:MAG: T9SS type A sorting domain-containing protein [Chlorobi bacterium]|nr:T9SS type A sorting domain-containing protein [Chlorobiota bacterium]
MKKLLTGLVIGCVMASFPVFAQQDTVNHWETVVFASDTFRYFPGTSQPPADWMQPAFDDTFWQEGPGGFGYGDGDDATVLDGILSVFLRKSFTITDTSIIPWGVLHMDYDDGFVAYLNGHEIARGNLGQPGTAVPYNQSADTWHEAVMYQGGYPETFVVPAEIIKQYMMEGENVLAIQVNNYGTTSSDFSAIPFFSIALTDSGLHYRQPPAWFIPPSTEFSSSLPIILINTFGQTIPDEPRIIARMEVIDNRGNVNKLTDSLYAYNGRISIELRGSSTQMFPKKAYSLETQDSLGENNNVSLLGLPGENDWVLYAPYSDKSMMRNVVAYKMWRDMGHWGPRTRYCELFLNGDYKGVYVFMEKIKRDKNRVHIARLDSADISGDAVTGGYILKIDKTDEAGIEGWTSEPSPQYPGAMLNFIQYVYPKYENLMPEQIVYIQYFMQQMESTLASQGFADPDNGYAKFIDPASFADFLLINELGKNVDGYRFSTYMYKDRDSNGGKLMAGPVWDFNLCFGNVDYGVQQCWDPNSGWVYQGDRIFWWKRLMQDPAFENLVKTRWSNMRIGLLSNTRIRQDIDSLRILLSGPQIRNYQRWPILGTYVWPNKVVYPTWEQEVDALAGWIQNRLDWMDSRLGTTGVNSPAVFTDILIYPNPFTDRIGFYVHLQRQSDLQIDIYSLNGRKAWSVLQNNLPAGETVITWDGTDSRGAPVAGGVYIFTISRNGEVIRRGKIIRQ